MSDPTVASGAGGVGGEAATPLWALAIIRCSKALTAGARCGTGPPRSGALAEALLVHGGLARGVGSGAV